FLDPEDSAVSDAEPRSQLRERTAHGFDGCGQGVERCWTKAADDIRPARVRERELVLGCDNADGAFASGYRDGVPDDRPVAGDEPHVRRKRAHDGVEPIRLQRLPNACDAFLVTFHVSVPSQCGSAARPSARAICKTCARWCGRRPVCWRII